jgi:hypothetical protein
MTSMIRIARGRPARALEAFHHLARDAAERKVAQIDFRVAKALEDASDSLEGIRQDLTAMTIQLSDLIRAITVLNARK